MNFVPQTKLEVQGKARHEAARRRNSECKINLCSRNSLAAMAVGLQRSGDSLRCRFTAIAARGISSFDYLLILHSELRRRGPHVGLCPAHLYFALLHTFSRTMDSSGPLKFGRAKKTSKIQRDF